VFTVGYGTECYPINHFLGCRSGASLFSKIRYEDARICCQKTLSHALKLPYRSQVHGYCFFDRGSSSILVCYELGVLIKKLL